MESICCIINKAYKRWFRLRDAFDAFNY